MIHTVTLLPDGKVLAIGGANGAAITGVDLYDPTTDTWSAAASLPVERHSHTATLLQNGSILVVGGYDASAPLPTAVRYDTNLGILDARRPTVTPATLTLGRSLAVTGTGFRGNGYTDASSGGTSSSATNYPLVQLRRLDNEKIMWLVPGSFTATGYTSQAVQDFQAGPALLTFYVNGIPSISKLIDVVNLISTTTSVAPTSGSNPSPFGVAQVFTATVAPSGATGTVSFTEGATTYCSAVPVAANTAPCSIPTLSVGTHTITATYSGGSNYTGSNGTIDQTVMYQLTIVISGTGNVHGSDLSFAIGIPSDIACSRNTGTCSALFPTGDAISLVAAAEGATSVFDSWSGSGCSGNDACSVTMDGNKTVTATFVQASLAKNNTTGAYYPTLDDALSAANVATPDEVLLLGTSYDGAITLAKGVSLRGGWNSTYLGLSGQPTTLSNGLTAQSGNSLLKDFVITGKLTVKGGRLRVVGVKVQKI
jgi:hypothetical protein